MAIKTESKTTIETTGHYDKGVLKTHPCDLSDWYSDEICQKLSIDDVIDNMGLVKGEYKITVTLERIDN